MFLFTIPFYTLTTGLSCVIVKYAESWVESGQIFWGLLIYEIINRIAGSCVYLSASAFHYQIADPNMGGVYMTTLNSAFNLGGVWVETLSLKAIGIMQKDLPEKPANYCQQYRDDYDGAEIEWDKGDQLDSYYKLAIFSVILGMIHSL